MNTALLSYLRALGYGQPTGNRLITFDDIARAFGGRPADLSKALHNSDVKGAAPMLMAISMAARDVLGYLDPEEASAFPIYHARANAGARVMLALRGGA